MNYRETQYARVKELMNTGSIFSGDLGNGFFRARQYPFILQNNGNNLYSATRDEIIDYFYNNNISWWAGNSPTTHPLSSQIACLNHLFPFRNDATAVLSMIKQIDPSIVEMLIVNSDEYAPAYIAFEVVSKTDHLNETTSTRGSNCTSLDAVALGKRLDGSRVVFPIEWKYTEFYHDDDKSYGRSGQVRRGRYDSLISQSKQLVASNQRIYYFEPFYQLMRQTLWTEQLIAHKNSEDIQADDYIHVHVVPSENSNLLDKEYPVSGMRMEDTWRSCLREKQKYQIISPEHLINPINGTIYKNLLSYLSCRYW